MKALEFYRYIEFPFYHHHIDIAARPSSSSVRARLSQKVMNVIKCERNFSPTNKRKKCEKKFDKLTLLSLTRQRAPQNVCLSLLIPCLTRCLGCSQRKELLN